MEVELPFPILLEEPLAKPCVVLLLLLLLPLPLG